MTYDVIEPRPDPNDLALDPEDHRAAVRDFVNARERITDAVAGYIQVVEDTADRVTLRATVPYRVTAYRHDHDADRVDELKTKHGATPPGDTTDGFVDVDTAIYRAIPHTCNQEFGINHGEDHRAMAVAQAHDHLESTVVTHLEDGEVSAPITVPVEVIVDDEPQGMVMHEPGDDPYDDDLSYRTKTRPFRVGTATYKVDGIVPPEEWEGGDE